MSDEGMKVISLFDEDAVPVGDEGLGWIPVRRRLGVEAFGVNAFRADEGQVAIEEHVESPGQEELYVVISGVVEFRAGDETSVLNAGQATFVSDPELRRGATALADGTLVLAVGGWTDQAYHSLPWEPIYLSAGPFARGEWQETIDVIEREAGQFREHGYIRYRLACCFAQLGETERGLDELRAAVEAMPELAERAASRRAPGPAAGPGRLAATGLAALQTLHGDVRLGPRRMARLMVLGPTRAGAGVARAPGDRTGAALGRPRRLAP